MKRRKITARRGKEGESEEALKRAKAGGGEKGIQTKTGRRKRSRAKGKMRIVGRYGNERQMRRGLREGRGIENEGNRR